MKNIQSNDAPRKEKSHKDNYPDGSSQDEIPVKNIQNGIVLTSNGKYQTILEILPCNFYKKSPEQQARILKSFGQLFNNGPILVHFKIVNDYANADDLINRTKNACKNQHYPLIKESLDDYISHVRTLSSKGAVMKRYFMVVGYEGKSSNKEEIHNAIYEQVASIESTLANCGNFCIQPENRSAFVAEIIYMHFNRKTYKRESFKYRQERMQHDFETYNRLANSNKNMTYADLFASKGLYFTSRNSVFMDGSYYGYIGIKGNTIPQDVYAGWIIAFDFGINVDIDIISKKIHRETAKVLLSQYNNFTKQSIREKQRKGRDEKAEKLTLRFQNNNTVKRNLDSGSDLYETAFILTVREESERKLGRTMRAIKRSLAKHGIQVDDDFLCCEEYFKMTMPFLYITSPFKRIQREILSINMESFFPFTGYYLTDPTGFVVGVNDDNKTLAAINNFNTKYYQNANMLILGTTGAGKTFTEQHIAYGMLMTGIRCHFIIPKKGYEYLNGCQNVGGTYVKLVPGSKDCINIMEIRPEGEINDALLSDDVVKQSGSLLSKKIMNLIVWVQLLLGNTELTPKQDKELNRAIVEVYESYGITHDNNSIYEDLEKRILKRMPQIEDFYNVTKKYPSLENVTDKLEIFVTGLCSNMNNQTNVDLTKDYIVYDIDEDLIPKSLLGSFLYIAFEHVYSKVKEDPSVKDAIFLDEVWKMMQNESCAEQVQNIIKLVRGYGACAVIATQEIEDFLKAKGGFGTSVINNSQITILLKLNENGIKLVKDTLALSIDDCDEILGFERGQSLFISNGDKTKLRIIASDREFNAYNTDVNYRGTYHKQEIAI